MKDSVGSGRLSLILFLAWGVVLLATSLTGYTLLRLNNPGAFAWAPVLLNRKLGLIAAATLVVMCVAAIGSLRSAVSAHARGARAWLGAALFAGLATLAVRALEMPSICLHAGFTRPRADVASGPTPKAREATVKHVGDAPQGKRIYLGTCAACHAPDGSGVKGQGQNLRTSTFLKDKTDEAALAFVKTGRQPFDPESKLHLSMPARGGNPSLSDESLLDAIAYVRELAKQADAAAAVSAASGAAGSPPTQGPASDQPQMIDGELWLPHSILPAAQAGPVGVARATVALQKPGAEGHLPSNVRRFFSVLLFVHGLHLIYLSVGLALGLALVAPTALRAVSNAYLATVALYWLVIASMGLLIVGTFYV